MHLKCQLEEEIEVTFPKIFACFCSSSKTCMFRLQGRIPSSPSVFTSDEYRAWLSRTPSTSAIYEQIRASRDVLNQQRAARFTYSAENIHAALKEVRNRHQL